MDLVFNNYRYTFANPSVCPHCHNGIEPKLKTDQTGNGSNGEGVNYSIWECTWRDCHKIFVSAVQLTGQGESGSERFLDGQPLIPRWPDTIAKMGSNFELTYSQSLDAEQRGLTEIAGMGFRKSIEYLVKDYLIFKDSDLRGKIEDTLLAKVIGDYFKDPREADLKDLLQRATWLGNDMTHYLRYHDNFDINDLKELIRLVVDEIHSIEQKRHYIASIQSKYTK